MIRAALDQPPGQPSFDAIDAIGLPFRIAILPVRLIGIGGAKLVGFTTKLMRPREISIFESLAAAGFKPRFNTIGPRSGQAFGLRFDRFEPVFFESLYSIRRSQHHTAGLTFAGNDRLVEVSYAFSRDAQPYFWGIGPNSRKADESDFRLDRQTVGANASFRLRRFTIGGGLGYEDNRVARGFDDSKPDVGDTFSDTQLFGVDERNRYAVLNLAASIDGTHLQGLQPRGVFAELSTSVFLGVDGTDNDLHRIKGAVNGYLPLNPRQAFALRGITEANLRESGPGVPFTHLAALGGDRGARAYRTLRFRDRAMIALMSEWRYEVWHELHERGRAEGFLLLDVGGVENSLSEFDADDLRFSYGFGMRLNWGGQARWLAYLAFGDEGARFDMDFSYVY